MALNPDSLVPILVTRNPNAPGYILYSYSSEPENPSLKTQHFCQDELPQHLQSYLVAYTPVSESQLTTDYKKKDDDNRLADLPVHLKNLAVIDSTFSGSHTSSGIYFNILQPLLKLFGLPHVYVSTTSSTTITNHAQSFSSSSTVIFLAGDTSIHEFVNALEPSRHLSLNIVAIPTGTGNALSSSIGHSGIPHAISRLFLGTPSPLSNFEVQFSKGSFFLNNRAPVITLRSLVVTSWAFHAALVADSDSEQMRKLGSKRFLKAAENNLEKDQIYHGSVTLNCEDEKIVLKGPHSYLLFTPVSQLEKGFLISPKSEPPSSKNLFCVQFDVLPGPEIMNIMIQAANNGSHLNNPQVFYRGLHSDDVTKQIATIQVNEDAEEKLRWCVDGRTIIVGGDDKTVKIFPPVHDFNGWNLFIIV